MSLDFASLSSFVDPSFWFQLSENKLSIYKLDESDVAITGNLERIGGEQESVFLRLGSDSFAANAGGDNNCSMKGSLVCVNTIEEFKNRDKVELIRNQFLKENPDLSNVRQRFILFTYADMKKYRFYFWFAWPALVWPKVVHYTSRCMFNERFASNFDSCITSIEKFVKEFHVVMFLVGQIKGSVSCRSINNSLEVDSVGNSYVCILDFQGAGNDIGWSSRTQISYIFSKYGEKLQPLRFLILRGNFDQIDFQSSMVFDIDVKKSLNDQPLFTSSNIPIAGWERNIKGQMGPRFVDLSSQLDPLKLSERAVRLNLELMKWRIVPSLDLLTINNCRCLLLGAGTLGCNVARSLLGWGVKNITFVDYGRVSYSNPPRQTLFEFADCAKVIDGDHTFSGKLKAFAAAEALKRIYPGVNAKGLNIMIPMPGHPVSQAQVDSTRKSVDELEKLIKEHDAIFLLLDSREARWLPTLLGKFYDKFVITCALGFDSFLVMRHGTLASQSSPSQSELRASILESSQLGCYFCGDIIGPTNSQKDRTMDQQCTVTLPGLSYMASGITVELLSRTLQHELRWHAPTCHFNLNANTSSNPSDTVLGPIPHQIRGFINNFEVSKMVMAAYSRCSACSSTVIEAFNGGKFDFLLNVFNEPGYLEDLTGIKKELEGLDIDDLTICSDIESLED